MFRGSTSRGTGAFLALAAVCLTTHSRAATLTDPVSAPTLYEATGVRGGLVVHVGCGDGALTAALHVNDRFVVQGLSTNAADVVRGRALLVAKDLCGPVSTAHYDGHRLPYVNDVVDLLVVSERGNLAEDELRRVLAPEGVACIRDGGTWRTMVKPRPDDIDEWSHFLHDASGNAVAQDRQVGPPRRLRWVAGPTWCRSHEFPTSVNALVTAGGRVFMIFDEGPSGVYRKLPQRCRLIARDAANGVLLWKVPMQDWQPEFGTGTGNRWNIHHTIPRRLIAEGDRVYVTLRFLDSPVSVLDAATGEILTPALEGSRGTDEMILSDGILIVKITKGRSPAAGARLGANSPMADTLAALDVATGRQLWRKERVRVLPYALSAQGGRLVYHNMKELVCLDARTGAERWRTPNPTGSTLGANSTLVISDGVVLFHGNGQKAGEAPKKTGKKKPAGRLFLTALSLADGRLLWQRPGKRGWAGACTQPTDLFVTHDVVWCASLDGRDLHTGEVTKQPSVGNLISPGHHYRCHRGKATERFLILPKRGAEFVDVEGNEHMRNDWLRGPCFTGITPANGLLYAPPDQCFCYPGVKVPGFLAMSTDPPETLRPAPATEALERGPAYGKPAPHLSTGADDWPMYRRDTQRCGATAAPVPAELTPRWEKKLTGRASQPVIVGDRIWVAERESHGIRCLSAVDGETLWRFTAGGRIDSAPTIHGGLALFGCRDGTVYCLRATDGALVWRFHAAPRPDQIVSYDQLESLWPVHGSVLVQDNIVYFAAGRSSYLDGGILVYGLDIETGELRWHHCLEGPQPDVMKDEGTPFAMEGALPDLLVSDGRCLYMERIKFDPQLTRLPTRQESSLGELDMGARHLVATGGFLDDTGFDRLYWMYSRRWPGFYFAQQAPKSGQLVVFDDAVTYAVKYFYRRIVWSPAFFPGEQGYLLFADDNANEPILEEKGTPQRAVDWLPKEAATDRYRRGGRGVEKGTGYVREHPPRWQRMIPLRVRAMVLAGGRLYAAGLPDVVDPADPLAALEGRKGARLEVFSAADGTPVKSYPLDATPAFDGMAAANGRLYLSTSDGKLICFTKPDAG